MKSIDRLREYLDKNVRKLPHTEWIANEPMELRPSRIYGYIDAIEQEHKQTLHDAVNKAHADGERNAMRQVRGASEDYRHGHDDGYLEAMGKVEGEYVALPVDADGIPIHVGNVMESDDGETFRVCRLQLFDSGWAIDGGKFTQSEIRHHRTPTVEDVLREFAAEVETAGGVMELPDATLAEFAAKLRLAGEDA